MMSFLLICSFSNSLIFYPLYLNIQPTDIFLTNHILPLFKTAHSINFVGYLWPINRSLASNSPPNTTLFNRNNGSLPADGTVDWRFILCQSTLDFDAMWATYRWWVCWCRSTCLFVKINDTIERDWEVLQWQDNLPKSRRPPRRRTQVLNEKAPFLLKIKMSQLHLPEVIILMQNL